MIWSEVEEGMCAALNGCLFSTEYYSSSSKHMGNCRKGGRMEVCVNSPLVDYEVQRRLGPKYATCAEEQYLLENKWLLKGRASRILCIAMEREGGQMIHLRRCCWSGQKFFCIQVFIMSGAWLMNCNRSCTAMSLTFVVCGRCWKHERTVQNWHQINATVIRWVQGSCKSLSIWNPLEKVEGQ